MKAAIMKRGKVYGSITVDSKVRSVEICGSFSVVSTVKESAKIIYKGKMFEKTIDESTEAEYEEVNETPVNIHEYKLSYAQKNIDKAEVSGVWASKVKCLDYPQGFYQLFSNES